MARVVMAQERTYGRLLTALRLAFYPAFEPAAKKRLEGLTKEATNARQSGDLARSEELYLTALVEAQASSDPSHLYVTRSCLARVYQEQKRYREAERIFRDQLVESSNCSQPNTQVHAAHMCLAHLYQDEGNSAKAEEHYKLAVAETEKPELWLDRRLYCSTGKWLARFYVEQHRYSEAEPLFQRVLEIYERDRSPNSCLPHHLGEFAKVYEAQEKYVAAEDLYLRALKTCQELDGGSVGWLTERALDNLATFYQARGRYHEAETLWRRSLESVEERIRSQTQTLARTLRWHNRKEFEARISRSQIPISISLDNLASVHEYQQKYAEAAPLRRRSLEIKKQAWGETHAWIWVDSIAAYANTLHKVGQEPEATKVDERVEAIQKKYPQGSVHTSVRLISRPFKKSLRWRFATFVNAILRPSLR